MEIFNEPWEKLTAVGGIRYTCGYCGTDTAPASGYYSNQKKGHVLICTYCNQPSFIIREGGNIISITPSPKMGKEINGLPGDVKALYDEARLCTSANAYTAAVLVCRKILMHMAVEKKAEPNKGFVYYVDYLAENHFIPPDGKSWVDYIRTKSNEANNEINLMSVKDAEDLITFVEMLLRLVYEFPSRLAPVVSPHPS